VGAGDDNWYSAQLYTFNLGSAKAEVVFKPEKQITAPRWSPDGKQIAFIAGLMSGNLGGNSGDVYSIASEGGPARNLTSQMKASAHNLYWRSASQILFREYIDGELGLGEVSLAGDVTQLWKGPDFSQAGTWIEKISLAANGKTSAVILESLDHAPEIWAEESAHGRRSPASIRMPTLLPMRSKAFTGTAITGRFRAGLPIRTITTQGNAIRWWSTYTEGLRGCLPRL